MRISVLESCLASLLLATMLAGCVTRVTQGTSPGLTWRVGELITSERNATAPGYTKGGGRAKDYRYVLTLEETRGVGVSFYEIETTLMAGRGTPRTASVRLRLVPNGQLRVSMVDSVWVVIPQWFEGTATSVSRDTFARKVFIGTDDRGDRIRFVIEFPLEDIPRR